MVHELVMHHKIKSKYNYEKLGLQLLVTAWLTLGDEEYMASGKRLFYPCLFVCNRGDTMQYHGTTPDTEVWPSPYTVVPNS